jgi:hypothetical protein
MRIAFADAGMSEPSESVAFDNRPELHVAAMRTNGVLIDDDEIGGDGLTIAAMPAAT